MPIFRKEWHLMKQKNKPDKIVRAGGKEFWLYRYYEESDGSYILDLPDFDESPEYTGDGRPFVLAVQESCGYGKDDNDPDNPDPGDCGCCGWFHRDEPHAPIGVCMCNAMKRENKEEQAI